eukprot:Colp12_sorted_trinity150504_noHs@8754
MGAGKQLSAQNCDLPQELGSAKVKLASFQVNFPPVKGKVHVANVSFEKEVTINYTCDGWQSCIKRTANYSSALSPEVDCFDFDLPVDLELGEKLEFAICYKVNATEFWDNNNDKNYVFLCQPHARLALAPLSLQKLAPENRERHEVKTLDEVINSPSSVSDVLISPATPDLVPTNDNDFDSLLREELSVLELNDNFLGPDDEDCDDTPHHRLLATELEMALPSSFANVSGDNVSNVQWHAFSENEPVSKQQLTTLALDEFSRPALPPRQRSVSSVSEDPNVAAEWLLKAIAERAQQDVTKKPFGSLTCLSES